VESVPTTVPSAFNFFSRLAGLLCVGVLLAGTARAAQLTVSADASVNSARPTTNFGTLSNLYVGGD